MINRGDKLYKYYWDSITQKGALETVTFLEESIVEGACKPSWLCAAGQGGKSRKFRCSPEMYFLTESEARYAFERDLINGINSLEVNIANLEKQVINMAIALKELRNGNLSDLSNK